ncbi:MAG: hypothetical protein IKA79_06855, partial [Lentisphaeria bacterium]|nr:hypothetical protein [Lentisphaeria bacterium]
MKRVMLFLAGCIFAASIVLNIYYSGKISALKKKEKASSSETAHTVKNSPAAPPSEKENNDFHFRSAEFYSWSNRICVEFSNVPLLTEASLAKSVTITPAIPLRFESTPGYLSLKGDFQPDKTYQVRLADSLTSTKGGKLLAPAVFFIKIPERSPKIRFLTTGPILPCKAGRITLPYAVTNVKKASLEIRKHRNELV